MTATVRAATPNSQPRYTISNIARYADKGLIGWGLDKATFFVRDTSTTSKLLTCDDLDTNPGSPTTTLLHDFTGTGTPSVSWVKELPDGEALVGVATTAASPNISRIYRSSGWSPKATRASATWSLVLTTTGGTCDRVYCGHQWNHGTDGVVILSEAGQQTTGGAGNDATDNLRAVRAFVSTNFGIDGFPTVFNFRDYCAAQGTQYPAGVHMHGVAYHEAWGRIWICEGDGTGDADTVAGAHNTQILYSDDLSLALGNVQKFPQPATYWDHNGGSQQPSQMLTPLFDNHTLIFTADVGIPFSLWAFPITGYKTVDQPHVVGPTTFSNVNGTPIYRGPGSLTVAGRTIPYPYLFSGLRTESTFTGTRRSYIVLSKDLREYSTIEIDQALTSASTSGYNFAIGPTLAGKIIILSSATEDGGYKMTVADLAYG